MHPLVVWFVYHFVAAAFTRSEHTACLHLGGGAAPSRSWIAWLLVEASVLGRSEDLRRLGTPNIDPK